MLPRHRLSLTLQAQCMRPLKQTTPTYFNRIVDEFVARLPRDMCEQITEAARSHHRSMNSEIIARPEQSLLQEGALQDNLGVHLDGPELSLYEHELLQCFRQLTHRQWNALVALIIHDAELAQA